MKAHSVSTVVEEDGHIEVANVPVRAGQRVQVIVLMPDDAVSGARYPLRGSKPFKFDRPDDPVGESDWEEGE